MAHRKKPPTTVGFNMTPMIDCTFQLIIFFLLATQLASADWVQMDLPDATQRSALKKYKLPFSIVVNLAPYSYDEVGKNPSLSSEIRGYQIGTERVDRGDFTRLLEVAEEARARKVEETKGESRDCVVQLRADKAVSFMHVFPVIKALQDAGFEKFHLVSKAPEGVKEADE